MCAVSNVGDMGAGYWPKPFGNEPYKPSPYELPAQLKQWPAPMLPLREYNGPTKEQFEEFLKLMRQAKKLDEAMGVADCESAAKVKWLKELADYLGCDVSDLVK